MRLKFVERLLSKVNVFTLAPVNSLISLLKSIQSNNSNIKGSEVNKNGKNVLIELS